MKNLTTDSRQLQKQHFVDLFDVFERLDKIISSRNTFYGGAEPSIADIALAFNVSMCQLVEVCMRCRMNIISCL